MNKIEIRPVNLNDVKDPYFVKWIFSIDEFISDNPEEFNFNELSYDEKESFSYGYFFNNKMEGYFKLRNTLDSDLLLLNLLFVNPAHQGKGIGQKIMEFIINKWNNYNIMLRVFPDNKKAIKLYKKNGFRITKKDIVREGPNGERNKYTGREVYIMERKRNVLIEENIRIFFINLK